MGRVARHVAALVAAVVGYYAGLAGGLAALGLTDAAEVAPLLTLLGGGLAAGAALGLFDGRRHVLPRSLLGLGAGLLLGLWCWVAEPELEWCVAALAVVSQALAVQSWSGTTR